MGRRNIKMELIERDKARMVTYQKRKKGLIKKAEEFSTLCGVPTCMVIYGPRLNKNNRPVDVVVWPKDPKDFLGVVELYRDKAFSSVKGVKSRNLSDFFAQRKKKVDEKISKMRKANYESKFSGELGDLNNFSMDQLKETLAIFDTNIDAAMRRLTVLKEQQNLIEDWKSEFLLSGCNASQVLFQKNMGIEVYERQQQQQPQIVSSVNMQQMAPYFQSNHQYHHYHRAVQKLPLDFNPSMLLMMNGGNQMGSALFNPMQRATYFDPVVARMINNRLMMNDPRATARYRSSTMQPLQQPHEQCNALPSTYCQLIRGSQFDECYSDMNEIRRKRQMYEL